MEMETIDKQREEAAEKMAEKFMKENDCWLDPTEIETTVISWLKKIGATEQVPMGGSLDLLVNAVIKKMG